MKILILALNFAPEPIGVGKYTGEFAQWLIKQGHRVRVVTAPPYYPDWRCAVDQGKWYHRERLAGIEVLRCPLWVPAEPSTLKRILHLASFALSSFAPSLWLGLRWRPDVVWTVEPTALAVPTALLTARLAGARACLHVQDLEIEAAFSLRMLPSSWLARGLRAVYGRLLRRFDLVSTISARMRKRLATFGVPAERLALFPSWVDTGAIRPLAGESPLRARLELGPQQLVALYAGNMGEKQGTEMLVEVADRLREHPQIRLVLCGAGMARRSLERRLADRPNVLFLPLQPRSRLNQLLNLADLHLLPQRKEAGSFALPSRLTGMLASGRPVVAQADRGEVARAARSCGILVAPGDAAGMAEGILSLAGDGARRAALGLAARRLAERHFEQDRVLTRYEHRLREQLRARQAVQPWGRRLLAWLVPVSFL
jgi:colanic acid biosynthesis glycosyl transferase WcaI